MPRQKPPKNALHQQQLCSFPYHYSGGINTDGDFWLPIQKGHRAVLCEFDTETQKPSYWMSIKADVCDIYVCAFEKWVIWLENQKHVPLVPGRKRADYVVVGEDLDRDRPPIMMIIEICEKSYLVNKAKELSDDVQQVKDSIERICVHSDDQISKRLHVEARPNLLYMSSFDRSRLKEHRTIGVVCPVRQLDVRQGKLPVVVMPQLETPIFIHLVSVLQTEGRQKQNVDITWFELMQRLHKDK